MSKINKNRLSLRWIVFIIVLFLCELFLIIWGLIQGKNVALFNSRGLIARQQQDLIIYTAVILLAIAIPTIFLFYFMAWKYRESNTKANYEPNKHHGVRFNLIAWGVPTIFMLVLAVGMWSATHRLEPQKPINSDVKPIRIQVISMRWKWLFLYPDQQIASVNFVQVPINTPVIFELTADEAPMSSFWIPNLGGQLYTMTGHVNRLNLIADYAGDYPGSSAEINGAGFAGMKFIARASSLNEFDQWVLNVKDSSNKLDATTYEKVLLPSENNPVSYYSSFAPNLYDTIVTKYNGPAGGHKKHE